MKTIRVFDRQSIFDIAIRHAGAMEAAFETAMLNDLSLTDDMAVGMDILIPPLESGATKTVREHFANHGLKPATSLSTEQVNEIINGGEGIEFWGIEYDFIVS